MDNLKIEVIETLVLLVVLAAIRFIINHPVNKALKKFQFSIQRRRIIIKIVNSFLLLSAVVIIIGIWGIAKEKLILFISSVLTIIGVAFFAQWSILSNITAGFILFFNHPLKIGDHIKVLEKDFVIQGTINDITFFFLHIKTEDGEHITIPNSVVLQKNISISHPDKNKNREHQKQ